MKSHLTFKSPSKRAQWVLYPTIILASLNSFCFSEFSQRIGGDALNGYVSAGKYFVCAHGSCSQVSSEIWHYSYWHFWISAAGMLLVFAEIALFVNTGDIPIDWDAS